MFCTRPPPGFTTPDFLDEAFRQHDNTFPTTGNQQELRVLAGAILRQAIENKHKTAIAAALGLVCGSYGRDGELPTTEHTKAAESFLAAHGAELRDVTSMPKFKATGLSKERFDELMPAAVFAPNQTPSARDPLFNTLYEQTNNLTSDIDRYSSPIWRIIQVQREELNILWWLQARFSRDLKSAFTEMTDAQGCLIIGTELADLTVLLPGSGAILGVIIAAQSYTKTSQSQITVIDAVNASPRQWRKVRSAQHDMASIGELCPILLAISKSLETNGDSDWLPVYQRYSDVAINRAAQAIEFSFELYHELLFSRAIVELGT